MGSPGVDGPPSPDYVPGPEAPHLPIYIPYVPEPEYPEFMPPEDHVFPAEEQPLPAVVSPTADSPRYVPESDPEGDPKHEDEEDPEEDPAYYPADIGDDDEEAWMAREAWGFSMDVSDDTCSHVLALRTTVVEQRALISGLQAADHQRQVQLTMALKLLKGLYNTLCFQVIDDVDNYAIYF
ncbi:hypothetical protein Tco_1151611 [Tanacetum coccineum]